jgi:tetratricopeptide (TPR) repeat protein
MFPNKKIDVDRHVEECLRKINNETERNLRCFSFAKQYFKIERYEEARRYVSTFLSARPNSAEAHLLLGKCLEMLGRKEAALQSYTTSLRLDPKQNNLVLKGESLPPVSSLQKHEISPFTIVSSVRTAGLR